MRFGRLALSMAAIAIAVLWLPRAGAGTGTTNASLNGPCVWQGLYYPTTSGDQVKAGPVSVVALLNFDGNGNMSLDYDANVNGTFSATPNAQGTYQVDPNGHGTFYYTSPASGHTLVFDFFITPQGHALRTMLRSYVGMAQALRVGNGICRFDL
ncbi:MAG TPA: hypothetical protein VKV28_01425 [Candidatus Binataceae bacterium]|nr:hypothetical protein [Candidatus Binataceae bacterium]